MAELVKKLTNIKNAYDTESKDFIILGVSLIIIAAFTKSLYFPTLSIFIFGLFIIAALIGPFTERNVFTIMISYLIIEPIAITTFFWVILFIVTKSTTNPFVIYFPLYTLPVISIGFVLMDFQQVELLYKVKVALEYNNAIFIAITGILAIYSFTNSDFSYLNPLSKSINLVKGGFNSKDSFDFLISVLGLPFLISNAFSKAVLEHRLWHLERKQ